MLIFLSFRNKYFPKRFNSIINYNTSTVKDSMAELISERPNFTLQWHLTAKCDQNCKHCYMKDSPTYFSELYNELSFEDCKKIIDDFVSTINAWNVPGRINFTGGDPLLRTDFFDILQYAKKSKTVFGILGNPNHITQETARRLKKIGVFRFQFSIDGLESTNDFLRGCPGLFKQTIKAIKLLKKEGIPTAVMFTVSNKNSEELIPVIRLVDKLGVTVFDFARLVPSGRGKTMIHELLGKKEYKKLLEEVLEQYTKLCNKGCEVHFGRKESLWSLLYSDLGLLKHFDVNQETIQGGCGVGCSILTVLVDGTVYPCRRLPIKVGKVPKESIRSIFINSKNLNRLRDITKFEKCNKCDLKGLCRGCMAVPYAIHNDPFKADPQCWKEA